MELALKIASKIRANERFAVYIVIPMQPEGHHFTEKILFWQVMCTILQPINYNEISSKKIKIVKIIIRRLPITKKNYCASV